MKGIYKGGLMTLCHAIKRAVEISDLFLLFSFHFICCISFFRMMEIVIRKIKNYVEVLPISTEFYTFAENSSFKAKSHEKFNVQILGSLADVVVLCYPCMVAKRVDQL